MDGLNRYEYWLVIASTSHPQLGEPRQCDQPLDIDWGQAQPATKRSVSGTGVWRELIRPNSAVEGVIGLSRSVMKAVRGRSLFVQ